MEQRDGFPRLAIPYGAKSQAEEAKTEQQADGLGPPWVKVGSGVRRELYNWRRTEPQGTPLAVLQLSTPKLLEAGSIGKTGVWESTSPPPNFSVGPHDATKASRIQRAYSFGGFHQLDGFWKFPHLKIKIVSSAAINRWDPPRESRRGGWESRVPQLASSAAQSWPTLRPCESQRASPPCPSPTPGVHSNSCPSRHAIQTSHPLSSPSPPAPNPSQHQGLFQWVNSLHEVAKVLQFQLQHQSFQWTPRTDLL